MPVTPAPPPAEGEHDFRSLALVNTRRLLPGGAPADFLDDETAADWLGGSADAAETAKLRELREAIRALFEANATRTAPAAGALAKVNEAAAAAPLVTQLAWDDTGPTQTTRRTGTTKGNALATLAADAIALLAGPAAARLHACGAHGCIRWYLRSHGARQWCSTRCADRVRAARHYARHHPGDSV